MMNDVQVVVELKTDVVNWFSELLTLLVFEQAVDDEEQYSLGVTINQSLLCECYLHILQLNFDSYVKMRNTAQFTKEANQYEYKYSSQAEARRRSNEVTDRYQDKELYELCQQLTRENRHLRRQVSDLKKLVAINQQAGQEWFNSAAQQENYREINYECYKKKAIQILTSFKFLQNLYVERQGIDKRNKILEGFMGKIKHGNASHIEELLKLYNQTLKGREDDGWNIDELERQSSQYQNNILRRHIAKLNAIMLESVKSLKDSLKDVKVDIVRNQERISHQIKFYCEKYLHQSTKQPEPNPQLQPQPLPKKAKKKSKQIQDENLVHKASWEKIVDQRSKLKQQKYQPNVKEKIHESLVIIQAEQANTMPLTSLNQSRPSIPKPQSKIKKQQITIIDQLQHSKLTGTGGSSITPHSIGKSRQGFKNSSSRKSQHQSPKTSSCYYR